MLITTVPPPPPSPPPLILQIHREVLKPGREAAYGALEEQTARACATLGCPHAYLAIESLTGTKEVWYVNGFASAAERQQVVDAYASNAALMAELEKNSKAKAELTEPPVDVFATYRPDVSVGPAWRPGEGRFLLITVTKDRRRISGTVFEADDGMRFVVRAAVSRAETDAAAAEAGADTRVFAVRPAWSFPAKEWIVADVAFWRD